MRRPNGWVIVFVILTMILAIRVSFGESSWSEIKQQAGLSTRSTQFAQDPEFAGTADHPMRHDTKATDMQGNADATRSRSASEDVTKTN
jgi:hypothetical protein